MSTLISQRLRSRTEQEWPGHRLLVHEPLRLDCGVDFGPFTIAYQTYGTLNPDRSNAILVCHALSGDQYAADPHPITAKPGWWETLIGPSGVLDTDRYFLICANVLGGCMGTTGPQEISPTTGEPWALSFPVITIRDMVRAQKLLIEHLGIEQLFCVIGGSMGGMQVLQWASSYPEAVYTAVPIAAPARHSAQNIAFHEVGRQASFCAISFAGDWLFPTSESRSLVHALNAVAANVSFVEIETDKGHDAFLLHEPELFATLRGFLTGCAEHRGITRFWS